MEEFDLQPGEEVLRTVRRHFFVVLFQLVPALLLAILPGLVIGIFSGAPIQNPQFGALQQAFQNGTSDSALLTFFYCIWYLLVWMWAFAIFTRYYLTLWVVTSTRIVEIRQYGFFRREVSSCLLNHVQDVTTSVSGVFGTILGFGRLDVETAGHDEKFAMSGVTGPEGIRDLIMKEIAILHAKDLSAIQEGR